MKIHRNRATPMANKDLEQEFKGSKIVIKNLAEIYKPTR
jgi:hypothetical protein